MSGHMIWFKNFTDSASPSKKKKSIFFESQGYWLSKSEVKSFPHGRLRRTTYRSYNICMNLFILEINKSTWITLCENCPNTELFLVRIFLYSDWIRRDTPYLSVFTPNTEKYGPEITPYLDTFHVVHSLYLNIFVTFFFHKISIILDMGVRC